jgi:hypothetical protein
MANVPSSPIPVTLMMEAIRSSETSVIIRTTRRNIPEDGILHNVLFMRLGIAVIGRNSWHESLLCDWVTLKVLLVSRKDIDAIMCAWLGGSITNQYLY